MRREMKSRSAQFISVLLTIAFIFGVDASLAQTFGASIQEHTRAYSIEGAWHGMVTLPDLGISIPTLDTFTSNSQKSGLEGTFLCTVPAIAEYPNPKYPNGWTRQTAAGHGNWVRVDKNKYAFTAMRTIFDQNGDLFGYAKNWGTIVPISKDEYNGTMNVQFYLADGTPSTTVFSGTLHSQRVAITFEPPQ